MAENRTGFTVRLPWGNSFTDQELIHLKQAIGHYFYPQISSGKNLEIKTVLSFPKTPEGQEILGAFERHVKEGEPIILKGSTIQDLHFPHGGTNGLAGTIQIR